MNFDEFHLDSEILSGVKRKGFSEPTPIQHQSIPEALNGHDVLGLAQTGTGKTAAFLLPVIQKIHKDKSRHIKSLGVVPHENWQNRYIRTHWNLLPEREFVYQQYMAA